MGTNVKKLPDGWIRKESISRPNRFYFFNTKTGKSQWEQPPTSHDKEKKERRNDNVLQSTFKGDTHAKNRVGNALKISDKSKYVKKSTSKTPAQDRLQDAIAKNKAIAQSVKELVDLKSKSPSKRKKSSLVDSIGKRLYTNTSIEKTDTMKFVLFKNKDSIEVDCEQDVRKNCVDDHDKQTSDEVPALFPPKTPAQNRLKTIQQKLTSPFEQKNDVLRVIHESFGIGDTNANSIVGDADERMDCDEMMECDNDETYSFQQLESMVIDSVANDSAYCSGSIIVPDTNVFLDSLTPIKQIIEKDQCSILIPFAVLQELDQLKHKHKTDKSSLSSKSSSAIRYIYDQLKMKNHRFQGQKAAEDNNHIIEVTSPDDKILNCCLQLKNQSKEVILLTNDINLSNKALVNGIEAITSKNCLEHFLS